MLEDRAIGIDHPHSGTGVSNMDSQTNGSVIRSCSKKLRLSGEEETTFELLASMTDDLLVEVLKRLPTKCACRCKAVCKHWYSLISTGYFINRFIDHRQEQNKSQVPPNSFTLLFQCDLNDPLATGLCPLYALSFHSLLSKPYYQMEFVNLDFLPHRMARAKGNDIETVDPKMKPILIEATCHDLLLCSQSSTYYAVNLLTKQWIVLPCVPSLDPVPTFPKKYPKAGLLCYCDLNVSSNGVSSNGDECGCIFKFKVILVAPLKLGSSMFSVQIFCSKARQWSKVNVEWYPFTRTSLRETSPILAYNGMLHWLHSHSLVSLDLLNGDPRLNLSHTINLPDGAYFGESSLFGVCQGHIRFATYKSAPKLTLLVSELEDYHKGVWHLVHRMLEVLSVLRRYGMLYELLAFHPYNEDVIFMEHNSFIYEFNLPTRKLRRFRRQTKKGFGNPYRCKAAPVLLPQWFPTPISSSPSPSSC